MFFKRQREFPLNLSIENRVRYKIKDTLAIFQKIQQIPNKKFYQNKFPDFCRK